MLSPLARTKQCSPKTEPSSCFQAIVQELERELTGTAYVVAVGEVEILPADIYLYKLAGDVEWGTVGIS